MPHSVISFCARWIGFAFELLYTLFGRTGVVGVIVAALSAFLIEVMARSGVNEQRLSNFESRLWSLLGATTLVGMLVFCVGLTIQKSRGNMMRNFCRVWWRGPLK